jgi:hypothetical protein
VQLSKIEADLQLRLVAVLGIPPTRDLEPSLSTQPVPLNVRARDDRLIGYVPSTSRCSASRRACASALSLKGLLEAPGISLITLNQWRLESSY